MFNVVEVTKENDINKILRLAKQNYRGPINLLFTSLWDSPSERLVSSLQKAYGIREQEENGVEPVYLINSFDTPHSFVIFNTTKVPHLVNINQEGVLSLDYLPDIYDFLGLK
jgi:hypothetical protein